MSDFVRPKKYLGQHFLKDKNIANKIVESLSCNIDNIIEIGPGTGILSEILIKKNYSNLFFIEKDKESTDFLLKNFPEQKNKIILADFLKFDTNTIFKDKFSIIGNFPYNISSQIFFKVLEERNNIQEIVCMIQKEVAERIASNPGNKKYGILSVLLQAYFDISYLFTVNENVFFPPPKVKSAVIKFKKNKTKQLACNEEKFFKIVKTAFNQRRKTLRNALKPLNLQSGLFTNEIFSKRAEQLNVNDFVNITNMLDAK